MSPEEITQEAYSDQPELLPDSGVDDRVLALHNFEDGENGTIYVLGIEYTRPSSKPKLVGIDNPIFQERLLHELVHHVQRMTGKYETYPCRNFAEREAYSLGGKFLSEQHVRDPLPNRNYLAAIYSRC